MNTSLLDILKRLVGVRVLVLGEAMLDSYLEGYSGRICREAPVPVVTVRDRHDFPGGAANTAVNARCLGGTVAFLSVVGEDYEGELLLQALARRQVATEHIVRAATRRTLAKHRVVAADQLLVRYDQGDTQPIDGALEQALVERLEQLFPASDAVIISDYGYGIFTPRIIETLARLQAQAPRVLVADSKQLAAYRYLGLTAVKPNYQETLELLGEAASDDVGSRAEWVAARGERVLQLTGAQIAAVTLDSEGGLIFERNSPAYRIYARPTAHAHVAGAGDTFVSALALALAAGATSAAAAELASAAAALVVSKDGTSFCSREELREYLSSGERYLADPARLQARVDLYRLRGQQIVFTNGCFDILHPGHVNFLNRAKALGDVLIVGVNSDASVRRLKGAGRPINSLEDRMQILAALSCIDHLIAFDEETPHNLIRAIRPDVFVKGGDYSRDMLPEATLVEELGGRVEILPYLPNQSTTSIIERIRRSGDTLRVVAVGERQEG